jgi:hypothetical protein
MFNPIKMGIFWPNISTPLLSSVVLKGGKSHSKRIQLIKKKFERCF